MKIQLALALINGASKAFHLLRKAERLKRFNLTCRAGKKAKAQAQHVLCSVEKAQQHRKK